METKTHRPNYVLFPHPNEPASTAPQSKINKAQTRLSRHATSVFTVHNRDTASLALKPVLVRAVDLAILSLLGCADLDVVWGILFRFHKYRLGLEVDERKVADRTANAHVR